VYVPDGDEFKLDAAAVAAEEAVERKEARHVKPWLSELGVPEWQGLAGGRAGWMEVLEAASKRARQRRQQLTPGRRALSRGGRRATRRGKRRYKKRN
jgi:hypothetical protein